jgi:hypothetical protein
VSSLRSASKQGAGAAGARNRRGKQIRQRYVPELSKVECIVITAKIVIVRM